MKNIIIFFFLLLPLQVFALTVTSVDRETLGKTTFLYFNVTLDDIDSNSTVQCIVYNDDKVAVGKGSKWIFGIGQVLVSFPSSSNAERYNCKDTSDI